MLLSTTLGFLPSFLVSAVRSAQLAVAPARQTRRRPPILMVSLLLHLLGAALDLVLDLFAAYHHLDASLFVALARLHADLLNFRFLNDTWVSSSDTPSAEEEENNHDEEQPEADGDTNDGCL